MVQLRPDQERVRTLIKETITLLCKNGLSFDAHFSIDALIGVTLDDKDVFLVNINELVKSEKAQAAESQKQAELSSEGDVSEDDSMKKKHPRWTSSQKRKRRKHSIKSEHGQEVESSSDENTAEYSPDEAMSQATRHPPPTSNRTNNIKREQREDSDNEQNNVIIIKEELDDSWQGTGNHGSHDDSSFGQFTDMPGTSQDQNFSSLADMSLMPVAPQDASQVWAQSAAYSSSPGGGAGRGMPRTTATSGSQQLDSAQEAEVAEDEKNSSMHFPSRLPPTEKKQQPRRRCRLCYSHGIRRESVYICVSCPKQPALCLSPCFSDYHDSIGYQTPYIQKTTNDNTSYILFGDTNDEQSTSYAQKSMNATTPFVLSGDAKDARPSPRMKKSASTLYDERPNQPPNV